MKILKGDLIGLTLMGKFDVIIQGCNCFGQMGAGFARQVRQTFPEAYQADLNTEKGSKKKLGGYSIAHVVRGNRKITVVNAYTQYDYGRADKQYADYKAIEQVFEALAKEFSGKNLRIGYPLIGAGLARGDWKIIGSIIDEKFQGLDHTLVIKD